MTDDARAIALQDRYAPNSICFGCGPANERGLHIKSYVSGDEVVAEFRPESYLQAYDGAVNGGIVGALLDCHSNWAATWDLMQRGGLDTPPATVTADYSVRFLRPTPSRGVLTLRARVVDRSRPDRATVESGIEADGQTTATFRGTFVAVKEGHPAFHRW